MTDEKVDRIIELLKDIREETSAGTALLLEIRDLLKNTSNDVIQ